MDAKMQPPFTPEQFLALMKEARPDEKVAVATSLLRSAVRRGMHFCATPLLLSAPAKWERGKLAEVLRPRMEVLTAGDFAQLLASVPHEHKVGLVLALKYKFPVSKEVEQVLSQIEPYWYGIVFAVVRQFQQQQ